MHDSKVTARLEMRWVQVTDTSGRTRLEARWIDVAVRTPAPVPAPAA